MEISQAATYDHVGAETGIRGLFARLHSIKLGGGTNSKMRRRDLAAILSNLSTLLENGVSLPKALKTLARERSLKRHAPMLNAICRRVEAGDLFSSALAVFPHVFDELMVHQIRVGEQSGTVADSLARITTRLEEGNQLRTKIFKRLSYPAIVLLAGVSVTTFLLLFIVPTFEETYQRAHIPLPLPTKMLMMAGHGLTLYGWLIPLLVVGGAILLQRVRRNPHRARQIDGWMLRIPIVGEWMRDAAVLQFVTVLGTMLESGFKLVDALGASINSIQNGAVRNSVEQLQKAIFRGEKLSHELEQHGDMFPPLVSQLVIVGESTGNLPKATRYIRKHLQRGIERKVEIAIGAIEPILTIGMAVMIGGILLAIYMPMFGMLDTVGG